MAELILGPEGYAEYQSGKCFEILNFTEVQMEAAGSAETLTPFYQTTLHSIPDMVFRWIILLHGHRCPDVACNSSARH